MAGTGNRHNRTRQAGRRQQIRPPHHRHGHAASSRAYCSSISRSPNFRKSAGQNARNEIWVAGKRQEKEKQNLITLPVADLLLQEDICRDIAGYRLLTFGLISAINTRMMQLLNMNRLLTMNQIRYSFHGKA